MRPFGDAVERSQTQAGAARTDMIVGFIGDVHVHVFHAIALAATWQEVTSRRFDLLIQVGDLGAFPDPERMDAATLRYLAADPPNADFRLYWPENCVKPRVAGLQSSNGYSTETETGP